MTSVTRGRTGSEQLLVLWTWLLEGYVPVAPIVADVDELEADASDQPNRPPLDHARAQSARRRAA